jgi:hypothetical protein
MAVAALIVLSYPPSGIKAKTSKIPQRAVSGEGPAVLWRDPVDIASRDLYYGPGGQAHQPRGTFTFDKEDRNGSSPKFEVIGEDGARWRVKMGVEARPETAASRLLWAAGYFANEDYFVPALRVEKMPHLHRGGQQVTSDGIVHDVRLKRHLEDEKKTGIWKWGDCPFEDTREWYGLRVLMAMMNNWDLKDVNNSIYQVQGASPEQRYVVSDLGASFGTTGLNRASKGSFQAYKKSKWIHSVSPEYVDFNVPSPPAVGEFFVAISTLGQRMNMVWIGRHIPRADARWMGNLLARLSSHQIRDAFRAAGYSATEVEGFSTVVESRIHELQGM